MQICCSIVSDSPQSSFSFSSYIFPNFSFQFSVFFFLPKALSLYFSLPFFNIFFSFNLFLAVRAELFSPVFLIDFCSNSFISTLFSETKESFPNLHFNFIFPLIKDNFIFAFLFLLNPLSSVEE